MANTAVLANPSPKESVTLEYLKNIWILFYRHGVNPHCQKGFYHNGDIYAANKRAKEHCDVMGYRFIFVRPLIVDIDEEEKIKMQS
jgi:hypothetical protein